MTKLGHIELFVAEPIRSKEFYEKLPGFEVVAVQSDSYVWLKAGEVELLLRQGQPREAPGRYERAAIGLVLYSDDMPETINLMSRAGITCSRTEDGDCVTFADPDGHWWQIVDPRDHQ